MSDTILRECVCCKNEADCIDGLCENCSIYQRELQRKCDLLEDDSVKLSALEAAGVDNWEGFDYAMEIYREEHE